MNDEAIVAMHALSSYLYNTSPGHFAQDLFGEHHPNYQSEWAKKYQDSKQRALGLLDFGNFRKLVELAMERFGPNSRAWVEGNKAYFAE